jgi:hypothetical protein
MGSNQNSDDRLISMVKQANIDSDASWHLDKRVNISIILAVIVQTGAAIWWGAKADERLAALERKVELAAPQGDRLTRVEMNIESIKDSLTEIKNNVRPRR